MKLWDKINVGIRCSLKICLLKTLHLPITPSVTNSLGLSHRVKDSSRYGTHPFPTTLMYESPHSVFIRRHCPTRLSFSELFLQSIVLVLRSFSRLIPYFF